MKRTSRTRSEWELECLDNPAFLSIFHIFFCFVPLRSNSVFLLYSIMFSKNYHCNVKAKSFQKMWVTGFILNCHVFSTLPHFFFIKELPSCTFLKAQYFLHVPLCQREWGTRLWPNDYSSTKASFGYHASMSVPAAVETIQRNVEALIFPPGNRIMMFQPRKQTHRYHIIADMLFWKCKIWSIEITGELLFAFEQVALLGAPFEPRSVSQSINQPISPRWLRSLGLSV